MKRDELTAALQAARAKLNSALEGLDEAGLTGPGPGGEWSVKDYLAHITAWDVDLLTNLGKVKRGQKPGRTSWSWDAIEAQNQAWHAEMKGRALDRVLADFDGVHAQLLRQVQALTEAELEAPAGWLQDRSISKYFVDHVVEHENEHAAALAEWRQQRP